MTHTHRWRAYVLGLLTAPVSEPPPSLEPRAPGSGSPLGKCATLGFVLTSSSPGKRGDRSVSVPEFEPPLDPGIRDAVLALVRAGVETFESCEGGSDHAYAEPTVRFHGDRSEGMAALAAALRAGIRVEALRRVWPIIDGEPTGPWWELTLSPTRAEGPTGRAS